MKTSINFWVYSNAELEKALQEINYILQMRKSGMTPSQNQEYYEWKEKNKKSYENRLTTVP